MKLRFTDIGKVASKLSKRVFPTLGFIIAVSLIGAFFLTATGISNKAAAASNSDVQAEHYVDVRIIAEKENPKPGDNIWIAIEHNISPEWHLYWANPGDSGIPIRIKWDLPHHFKIKEINWPVPDKIITEPLANYGYKDRVILLQKLSIPKEAPKGTATLKAKVDMLVCKEICLPETANASLTLNIGEALASGEGDNNEGSKDNLDYIQNALAKMPESLPGKFTFQEDEGNLVVRIKPEDDKFIKDIQKDSAEFYPLAWGVINHYPSPKISVNDGEIVIKEEKGDISTSKMDHLDGVLTVTDRQGKRHGYSLRALPFEEANFPNDNMSSNSSGNTSGDNVKDTKAELYSDIRTDKKSASALNDDRDDKNTAHKDTYKKGERSTAPLDSPPIVGQISLVSALLFAFVGGLILNLMPCVFPIISMKALSLVKLSGKEKNEARMHGLFYTAGVIISFIAIGLTLVFLKAGGSAIGWGFQLQNPIVITLLAYLLFVIGLNLIGFFQFRSDFGNIGHKLTNRHSLSGSFFTGTLATIVATPCMAPFMAAAMGYALTQNAVISTSIFIALGFGLAFPYLLLCYVPAVQRILPKPGAWMETFKQFLAFPMFGFSIWLISILAQQTSSTGILMALLGMLSLSMAVWLAHMISKRGKALILRFLFITCLALPFLFLSIIHHDSGNMPEPSNEYSFGENFTKEKLSRLLKGNDPVFVEMTAAWCITCKVNQAVALDTHETKAIFKENNVRYLIGDWTNYDKEITDYLAQFGRNGVPIYVYYAPRDKITGSRPKPEVLPQILTPGIVKSTFTKK